MGGTYRVLAATSGDALAEGLRHLENAAYAVGRSVAVLHEDPAAAADAGAALRAVWPMLQQCGGPQTELRLGLGTRAEGLEGLRASLSQARFALTSADEAVPVRGPWGRSGTGCCGRPWRSSWPTTAPGPARRRCSTCT
ncbi:hypothetical protein [Streptomyces sp. DSM 40907]|uniref:hypothetical protein n=1 Tax=Streptomyces kutzneri TaxID=3051179 RepID=UPI0028D788AE|nr:hypothetical protein [Streptomyces sp. DSM 40907]